jgi:hypothetical protein
LKHQINFFFVLICSYFIESNHFVPSSSGGLARLSVSANPGQTDTLANNQPINMIATSIGADSETGANGKTDYHVETDPWVWSYFGGQRWLPDNNIQTLVAAKSRKGPESSVILVQSATGLSYIESALFTLAEKATVFETFQTPRHDRHGLTADCKLSEFGNLTSYVKKVDDNDGLWTSMHVLGE